jgi:hypothetical protein
MFINPTKNKKASTALETVEAIRLERRFEFIYSPASFIALS